MEKIIEGLIAYLTKVLEQIRAANAKPPTAPQRETPAPDEARRVRLALIVGHEKTAPGADLVDGTSEYVYNSEIARLALEAARGRPVDVQIFMRDGVGISGAYQKAIKASADCMIELHFNSYNGQVPGTETLCSMDNQDIEFARDVHEETCKIFSREGLSRGVKPLPRTARGGESIASFPNGPNCLVEPFFGDHKLDADMALARKRIYAAGLVNAVELWAKKKGAI